MSRLNRRRLVPLLFDIGVIAKGIDGTLEVLGGVLLFLVNPVQIHRLMRILTQHELSEDPRDVVAHYLLNSTRHLSSGTKEFAALYLLWHGAVKVGLVTGLLLKRHWAYPLAIFAFAAFVVYQLYRYSHTGSPTLLVLSAFDVVVIILTWLEYRRLRSAGGFASAPKGT